MKKERFKKILMDEAEKHFQFGTPSLKDSIEDFVDFFIDFFDENGIAVQEYLEYRDCD